jgi:hypothetical protein
MFARKHQLPQIAMKQATDTFILKGLTALQSEMRLSAM